MHFTTSFLTGAVVALYATQIAAAPVLSRGLLGARSPLAPATRNRLPISQMGDDYKTEATESCGGDASKASDKDYFKCMSVKRAAETPTIPEVRNRLPVSQMGDEYRAKATESCDASKTNDKDYIKCMSAKRSAAQNEAPVVPETRNRLPVSQMGDDYKTEATESCGDASKADDKEYVKCMAIGA
ncbi:hypothetical protein RB595_010256 [Gaeumannomyces hyphopodioides]